MDERDTNKTCAAPEGFSNVGIALANPEHAIRETLLEGMKSKNMEEIDIQTKLAAWQARMGKKREAEAEQGRLEAQKRQQQEFMRLTSKRVRK